MTYTSCCPLSGLISALHNGDRVQACLATRTIMVDQMKNGYPKAGLAQERAATSVSGEMHPKSDFTSCSHTAMPNPRLRWQERQRLPMSLLAIVFHNQNATSSCAQVPPMAPLTHDLRFQMVSSSMITVPSQPYYATQCICDSTCRQLSRRMRLFSMRSSFFVDT